MSSPVRSKVVVAIGCAIVIVCPIVAGLAVKNGSLATLGVAALLALGAGVYVGLRHPTLLLWMLAAALGALPFGYFPGIHLPLTLALGGAVLLAAIIHPSRIQALSRLEVAMLLLVLASGMSVVATAHSIVDVTEFAKWSISALLVLALLRLSQDDLARFGRLYVYACAAAAVFAIVIYAVDPNGKLIRYLSVIGYGRDANTSRYFYGEDGVSLRLSGTYIDPNGAGVFLLIALVLCLVLLRGWMRWALSLLFVMAIVFTLSRAAIFSLIVGVILVLLFHPLRRRDRQVIIGAIGLGVVAAFAAPPVRARILDSFGSSDVGSSAREDALRAYPGQMAGNWLFGLGWGRPEFKSGATGFTLNHVANAPLLTIYRGGVITGLMFIAVLLIGGAMSYRMLRSKSLPAAFMGGVFISFCLIALQLDFPTVTVPAVTMVLSVFLLFLVYVQRTLDHPPSGEIADERGDAEPAAAAPSTTSPLQ